jgi:hypothetical protein
MNGTVGDPSSLRGHALESIREGQGDVVQALESGDVQRPES